MPYNSGITTRSERSPNSLLDRAVLPVSGGELVKHEGYGTSLGPALSQVVGSLHWPQKASRYFDIYFDPHTFETREVEALIPQLDEGLLAIGELVGREILEHYVIYLADERSPGFEGQVTTSCFDAVSRAIMLVRVPTRPLHSDLLIPLTHAMCSTLHQSPAATRPMRLLVEDAFAAYVNTRLAPHSDVFPYFGVEPDVICHELFQRRAVRTFRECLAHPLACSALERHVIGGAFFLYLADTYGDERLLNLFREAAQPMPASFTTTFDASLEDLENVWMRHLPDSLVALTSEERELAILHWDTLINYHC
jgi:hypothetical protein